MATKRAKELDVLRLAIRLCANSQKISSSERPAIVLTVDVENLAKAVSALQTHGVRPAASKPSHGRVVKGGH